MNLHDASGVQSFETHYAKMAVANNINPATKQPVPFNVTSRQYMDTLHQIVMQPILDVGVDFWWTDWQQGGSTGVHLPNVNPTLLLNQYRVTWEARQVKEKLKPAYSQERGVTLARYVIIIESAFSHQ